jgi:hypothetical protein
MPKVNATERRLETAEEFLGVARSIAKDSTDPGVAYARFLRRLELGHTLGSRDRLMGQQAGNGLTDSFSRDGDAGWVRGAGQEALHPADVDVNEFPTEWTLDSLN